MRELEQAGELARGLGIEFDRIVPLRSTNNTVGWLAPSDVVVKVGRDAERSSREVAIARALAEQGAPIVGPSDAVVARAHPIDQQCVATFWTYVSQTEGTELSAGEIAESLHGVHTSLGELGGEFELPNCTVGIQHAIDALDDAGFAPQLRVGERALLRVALAEGAAGLVSTADCVIHGAPHRFNILAVAGLFASSTSRRSVAGRSSGTWPISNRPSRLSTRVRSMMDCSPDAEWRSAR